MLLVAEPLSVFVETYGTGVKSEDELAEIVKNNFDLRPGCLIRDMNLKQPFLSKTSCYGHFGRAEKEFAWEHAKELKF